METLLSANADFTMTKLDNRAAGDNKDEIRVILIAHNEITRLPFLLDYYRKLGVNRFFVVDDKSTDGTREYLLAQPDCHVFDPSNTYRESQTGRHWRALLLNTYGADHWTLVLDADELLVYPHCEHVNLKQLCNYLDSVKARVFFAFMLDLYAATRTRPCANRASLSTISVPISTAIINSAPSARAIRNTTTCRACV